MIIKKQKGGIFKFGKNITPSNYTLSNMDISKLEDAPLHNLGAERRAGLLIMNNTEEERLN